MAYRVMQLSRTDEAKLFRVHPEIARIRRQRNALNDNLRWKRETGGDNSAILVALHALALEEDALIDSKEVAMPLL